VTEYVPLNFTGALIVPAQTESGGNVSVPVALASGVRLVTDPGADARVPEAGVAQPAVTWQ
jgi:hypothetical protein